VNAKNAGLSLEAGVSLCGVGRSLAGGEEAFDLLNRPVVLAARCQLEGAGEEVSLDQSPNLLVVKRALKYCRENFIFAAAVHPL
jgi:hypothetical protein